MLSSHDIVLVTGGAGAIGMEFVHRLAVQSSRPTIRVAVGDSYSLRASLLRSMTAKGNVVPVTFDPERPETVVEAVRGVTHLMIIGPCVRDIATWHEMLIGAVLEYGACRYAAKVSAIGARPAVVEEPESRIHSAHWHAEQVLRRSKIPSTIIRPTVFMQQFITVPALYRRGEDAFHLPIGGAGVAFLDSRDVGRLGAALVSLDEEAREPHVGQCYDLTGPAALTATEVEALISAAAGRRIRWEAEPRAFVSHARTLGVSDLALGIYTDAATGMYGRVDYEIFRAVLGQHTSSFAKFVADNAHHFAP